MILIWLETIVILQYSRCWHVFLVVAGLNVWPPPGLARPPGRLCRVSAGRWGQPGNCGICVLRAESRRLSEGGCQGGQLPVPGGGRGEVQVWPRVGSVGWEQRVRPHWWSGGVSRGGETDTRYIGSIVSLFSCFQVYNVPWMGTTEILWDATSCQRQ